MVEVLCRAAGSVPHERTIIAVLVRETSILYLIRYLDIGGQVNNRKCAQEEDCGSWEVEVEVSSCGHQVRWMYFCLTAEDLPRSCYRDLGKGPKYR